MHYLILLVAVLWIPIQSFAQSNPLTDSLQMEEWRKEGAINLLLPSKERKEAFEKAEQLALQLDYPQRQFHIVCQAGDYYKELEEYDKAVAYYEKAIHLKESLKLSIRRREYAAVHNTLAYSLQAMAKDSPKKQALLEKSILHSRISSKIRYWNDKTWLLLGNSYILLGNAKIDQMNANTALEHSQKQVVAEEVVDLYEQALFAYKKVEKIKPNHPDIEQNLGVLYKHKGKVLGQHLGRLEESIAALENAIFYDKKEVETYRLIGVATGMKGYLMKDKEAAEQFHKKAIAYFEKGLALDVDNVSLLYNLQIAYLQLGKTEQAQQYEEQWKAIDPNYNPNNSN